MANERYPMRERDPMDEDEIGRSNEEDIVAEADDEELEHIDEIEEDDEDLEP